MNQKGFLIFLLLGMLTACIPGSTGSTAENAAAHILVQNHNAIPDSINIHQTQPWEGKSVVLASFTSNQDNKQWSCEAVFEMKRGVTGWQMSGSGIGCSNPPNTEPITYGSGTQGEKPEEYSYAYGLVTLTEAQKVRISWQDGNTQLVPIINGSYLALREGTFLNIPDIQILNAADEVIDSVP